MSSAIYVTFDEDEGVKGDDWAQFCREHAIRYSPQTVGANTFYAGEVEISFGKPNWGTADWRASQPPGYAETVTFSTYHLGSAMPQVAELARTFWLRFGGSVSADEELRHLFAPGTTPSRTVAVGEVVRDRGEITA